MKWQLSQAEFNAVYTMVESVLFAPWGNEVYDKLLQTVLARLYKRMYGLRISSQPKYKMKVPAEECLCFYECLIIHNLPTSSFEGNTLNMLLGKIDKEFAIDTSLEIIETKNYLNQV